MEVSEFTTSDGVTLRYREAGSGPTVLMLHGWSQGAALFKHQLSGLSDRYRTIALDMRGHGQSDKPDHGYRIARLATDLHEFLQALDLQSVDLIGHSAGCAVIWSRMEMFGSDRIAKLVLIDEPAALLADPGWSEVERLAAGGILKPDDLYRFADRLAGPEGEAATREMISSMVTPAMSAAETEAIIAVNLQFPRPLAARLLVDNVTQDWRDFIPRITLPTLIVFGRSSPHPIECQQWIHEQIAGSKLEVFETAEGGSHFLFYEAPDKFNRLVADFFG